MFYDRFKQLCEKKGISCNKAALEIGLSNAIVPKWKKTGATPGGETLNRIAVYFGVSIDFLLGAEKEDKPSADEGGRLDENTVRIAGRDGRFVEKQLTDAQIDMLLALIDQLPDAKV